VNQQLNRVGGKIVIEPPKTKRSRRTIKMPAALVTELERHRKDQLEQRLRLDLGGRPELVFTAPTSKMFNVDKFSKAFTARISEPMTFHCLRHTHITLLLRSGVPVHVVSARAGHAKPSITLDTYCT
jgi:integrase